MRKIDKDLNLATAYKKWLDNLNKSGKDHPEYNSSSGKFYYDIVANLLWVQKGLCAYTEMYLVNPKIVDPSKWDKGSFNKFEFLGNLDHYDSTLKKKKGWEWTNFFMIHTDVNQKRKRDKKVNYLLKPDQAEYNPFYFLEYDFKTDLFLPSRERTIEEQEKIKEDIFALGLNYQPITDYRKEYIKPLIEEVKFGQITVPEAKKKLTKFYTAFEMSLSSLNLQ